MFLTDLPYRPGWFIINEASESPRNALGQLRPFGGNITFRHSPAKPHTYGPKGLFGRKRKKVG